MKIPGFNFWFIFNFLLNLFRFFIEFFRVPDEQLGYLFLSLTMGQIISFDICLVSE